MAPAPAPQIVDQPRPFRPRALPARQFRTGLKIRLYSLQRRSARLRRHGVWADGSNPLRCDARSMLQAADEARPPGRSHVPDHFASRRETPDADCAPRLSGVGQPTAAVLGGLNSSRKQIERTNGESFRTCVTVFALS